MGTILLTGATGRVGANLARALVERGDRVRALVLPDDPKRDKLAGLPVEIREGSLTDFPSLARAAEGCEVVLHTACVMGRPAAMDRREYFAINVAGTMNLLEAVVAAGCCRRFIYTSSDIVYPSAYDPLYWPVDEAHPLRPHDEYGRAKVLCEEMVTGYARETGLPVVILRPGGQIVAADEILRGWTAGTMASLMQRAARVRRGQMYLPDRSPWEDLQRLAPDPQTPVLVRDPQGQPWIWSRVDVRDVVQGHLLALDRPSAVGEAFNLPPPLPHSFDAAVPLVAAALGQSCVEWEAPVRWVYWNSGTKARMLLGYRPEFDTEGMIADAVRFRAGEEIGVIPA